MAQTRKLRESCDACHMAKVKCIKSKADCVRCSASGVLCSFSPSDRRGKPRGAKNKVNRIPNPVSTKQAEALPATRAADPYPSPTYDFSDFYYPSERVDIFSDGLQGAPTDEGQSLMDMTGLGHEQPLPPPSVSTSLSPGDWLGMETPMLHPHPSNVQQMTSRTSMGLYPEPVPSTPPPFPESHQVQRSPAKDDGGNGFDGMGSDPLQASRCSCFPINLQSLYTLHCHSLSTAANIFTPFDIALFINNKAIGRCASMLACTQCVMNPDMEKSSTGMLLIAGALDDILVSYSTTCMAYLDSGPQEAFILSSGDAAAAAAATGSAGTTSPKVDEADFMQQSSGGSSSSASLSSIYSPSSQLSLGTYRVEGEDGRHLKLEILKIELRKVERLWTAFRDTCALQKFEDEQKSLYAALVCYLAKKLRRTSEMLEARRRVRGSWLGMS